MERSHSWPAGHWDWPIHVSHKHGLRCGDMIFVGGQVDLDSSGRVLHADDLAAQTAAVMRNIAKVLAEFGADLGDLVKLIAFYQNDGSVDEDRFLAAIALHLPAGPGPVITAVPAPALAYPGMIVEIEAIAMRGAGGVALPRTAAAVDGLPKLPPPLSHGLRCGEMIFVGGQTAVDATGNVIAPGDIVRQSEGVVDRIGPNLSALWGPPGEAVKNNNNLTGGGKIS